MAEARSEFREDSDVDDRVIIPSRPDGRIFSEFGQGLNDDARYNDAGTRMGCHRTFWSCTGPAASTQRFRASDVEVDCTSKAVQFRPTRTSPTRTEYAYLAAPYSSAVKRRAGTVRPLRGATVDNASAQRA